MSEINTFIDTYQKLLVAGTGRTDPVNFPTLYYGDTYTLRLYFLKPTLTSPFTFPTPYDTITTEGLAVKLVITESIGTGTIAQLAAQSTWVADANGVYAEGELAVTTTEMKDALDATTAEFIQPWMEVKIGANMLTVYQQKIVVRKRAFDPTTIVSIPEDEQLSKAEAAATYVPFQMPQGGFILWKDNNGVVWKESITTDGQKTIVRIG